MLTANVAEWFLSLFTTRDRASAIAGDLAEQRRVSIVNVLATGTSLFLRSAGAQPLRLVFLMVLGVVLWIVGGNIASIPFRFGFRSQAYGICSHAVAVPALVGYILARFTRDRELTGCLAFSIMVATLTFGNAAVRGFLFSTEFLRSILGLDLAIPILFLLAAGALTRYVGVNRNTLHADSESRPPQFG